MKLSHQTDILFLIESREGTTIVDLIMQVMIVRFNGLAVFALVEIGRMLLFYNGEYLNMCPRSGLISKDVV